MVILALKLLLVGKITGRKVVMWIVHISQFITSCTLPDVRQTETPRVWGSAWWRAYCCSVDRWGE